MSSTTFVDYVTPVPANWLNDVNNAIYSAIGNGTVAPTTPAQVVTNLGLTGTSITYTPPGTGAVSRTLQSKLSDVISVKDFGATGNGTTDDTTFIQNALNYIASIGSGSLYFPKGTYKLTAQLTYTYPSILGSLKLFGDGADATNLSWAAGGGLSISTIGPENAIHIRDMSFLTGAAGTGSGLLITQTAGSVIPSNIAISDITNVTFRGIDGYGVADYWSYGIQVIGQSSINFVNLFIMGPASANGTGVFIHGSSSVPPVVFNFTGCIFNNLAVGFNYGNYVQGVSFSQCNWGFNTTAIFCDTGLSNTQSQLSVVDCQMGFCTTTVALFSTITPFNFCNNLVEIPNTSSGITLQVAGLFTITGNTFLGLNTASVNNGINVISMSSIFNQGAGLITGNMFYNLNFGVFLQASSSHINVQSNSYIQCNNTVGNAGTSNTIGGGSP